MKKTEQTLNLFSPNYSCKNKFCAVDTPIKNVSMRPRVLERFDDHYFDCWNYHLPVKQERNVSARIRNVI